MRKIFLLVYLLLPGVAAAAQEVTVDAVRPSFEGNVRPGEWHPVHVTLSAQAAFEGTVTVMTDTPLRFSRRIALAPHQKKWSVTIPAIFYSSSPALRVRVDGNLAGPEIEYREPLFRVYPDEWMVGVEEGMVPVAWPAHERCRFFAFSKTDLAGWVLPDLMESVDALVLPADGTARPAALDEWEKRGGRIYPDLEAFQKDDRPRPARLRFSGVDLDLYSMMKRDSWRGPQRIAGFFMIGTYVFLILACGFVLLLRRAGAKRMWVVLVGVSAVAYATVFLFFPGGSLSARIQDIRWMGEDGTVRTQRITTVQSYRDGVYGLTFYSMAKPVFWERPHDRTGLTLTFTEGGLMATGIRLKKDELMAWGDVGKDDGGTLPGGRVRISRTGDILRVQNDMGGAIDEACLLEKMSGRRIGAIPAVGSAEVASGELMPPWADWLRKGCGPGKAYVAGRTSRVGEAKDSLASVEMIEVRHDPVLLMIEVELP